MSSNLPSDPSQGERATPEGPLAADDLLPPVEPPNAKFIIQLFVTPMVIVAAVVGVWLLIQWLANSGETNPEKIVAALRSTNQARFQQATELSHMLQAEGRYPELKTNRELVQGLADLLVQQVDEKREGEGDVTMRTFLTRSLGEFHVDDGLPALIATAQRDAERGVRRDAINAIAVLAKNVPGLDHPELPVLMHELADSEDELFRSEAAFALGVLAESPGANPEYRDLLAILAEDFYPDARYNAGVGLARLGDPRAVPVLQEMLDLDALVASVDSEQGVGAPNSSNYEQLLARLKTQKRNVLIKNGLRGVELLLEKQQPADLAELGKSIEKLLAEAARLEESDQVPESLIKRAEKLRAEF